MKIVKIVMILAALIMTVDAFSQNYYIRQMLVADMDGDDVVDTTYQENFIFENLIVIADEHSISFVDDSSYTFYNLTDSTYFSRSFEELSELASFSDSQLRNFDMKKTGTKQKTGKWETEKYSASAMIMGMEMDLEMYISKDTGFPVDIMVRQQEKMHKDAKNIRSMINKIKATGGIVVKEVARIGGSVVSEKQIVEMKKMSRAEKELIKRPSGFKEMEQ